MKDELLKKIKANKKYRSLSDDVVLKEIEIYLKAHPSSGEGEIVKEVRRQLHLKYASFQTRGKNKIAGLLVELRKEGLDMEVMDKLLSVSLSTKERLKDYSEIYSRIFEITGRPKVILDLGSGLNGFSIPYMNLPSVNYYCYDIDERDAKFLNEFFEIVGVRGEAGIIDLSVAGCVDGLPKSDVVFLFKVLDVIDVKDHKVSEGLMNRLMGKTNFVVVSFATRTLTRKKMNNPNRKWFELMCSRRGWKFEKFEIDNEIFYVVGK